jgi:hypothetical protein
MFYDVPQIDALLAGLGPGGSATNVVWPAIATNIPVNIQASTNGLVVSLSTVTNPVFSYVVANSSTNDPTFGATSFDGRSGAILGLAVNAGTDSTHGGQINGAGINAKSASDIVIGSGTPFTADHNGNVHWSGVATGNGGEITNLAGNGRSITNIESPNPLSYLDLQNVPLQLSARSWVGNLKLMERLQNTLNYTNILPLADTNTVDTRLIDLITNGAYGTCIVLSNGVYNIGNTTVVMNAGITILGQSVSNTIIYKQGNFLGGLSGGITARRDCCLANFTLNEIGAATTYTSGIVVDPGTYQDNFGILIVNVVALCDSDSGRFINFNGELRAYNSWFDSHWDGWVMDSAAPGSQLCVYNDYHNNDTTKSLHSNPDGNRPMRSAAYLTAYYSTFVAKDAFNPGDETADVCVGPCGPGVFLGDCIFSLTTGGDNSQGDVVGQVVGATTSMTIVSGGTYDATKFLNKVRILQ